MFSLSSKKYNENKFFPSKLFFTFEKFPNNNEDNSFENTISKCDTNFTSQNETISIRHCLTKELLDTIDFSILNETKQKDFFKSSKSYINKKDSNCTFNYSFNFFLNKNENCKKNLCIKKEITSNKNLDNQSIKKKKKKNKKIFEEREGDWNCYFCKNLNFSFRKKCNKCGVIKNFSESLHDKCMENILSIINNNQKRRKEDSSFI
jgi:hypothetical protein